MLAVGRGPVVVKKAIELQGVVTRRLKTLYR
jgi:hypothetical protein